MSIRNVRPTSLALFTALCLIVVAIWFTGQREAPSDTMATTPPPTSQAKDVRPIDSTDHVMGNPSAPLVFIVYSDFRCPFCKDYHKSMKRIVAGYGKDGDVAWVFRHMPIVSLHPESPTYALASECVAQEGGESAFWEYADVLFEANTEEYNPNSRALIEMAVAVGVSEQAFTTCMRTSNLMSRVEADFDEAIQAGARSTPYSVIVTPYQHIDREGVRSYNVIAATVETVLRNLKAKESHGLDESEFNFDVLEEELGESGVAGSSTPLVDDAQ